jgi:hypothetical protein
VFGAPVVAAERVGIELFPAGEIAGEDGVDSLGAAAGEELVELVVADGIGVAEDGERGARVGLADQVEAIEFRGGGGADEGAAEIEADIVQPPTGNGGELFADDGAFRFRTGSGVDGERAPGRVAGGVAAFGFFARESHALRDKLGSSG